MVLWGWLAVCLGGGALVVLVVMFAIVVRNTHDLSRLFRGRRSDV